MPFGYLLKRFRVRNGLSLRRLGELASVDHAYINRLEIGHKESPSEVVVRRLVGALGLGGREAWLLGFVAEYHRYLDIGMIEFALSNPAITPEEFSWATGLRFRQPGLDYPVLFGCARQIMKTVERFLLSQGNRRSFHSAPGHLKTGHSENRAI